MMAISALIELRGEETARLFQQSQEAAVARIEENVNDLGISCNFRRLDAFLFPAMGMDPKEARDQRDKEYAAARKVGAAVERIKGVPLKGFEDAPVLAISRPGNIPSAQISRRPGVRDPHERRTHFRKQRRDRRSTSGRAASG